MAKWTPVADRSASRLVRPGWTASCVEGLSQILLSGDLEAAFAAFDPRPASVGLWGIASPERAAIRIGRDRALLATQAPVALDAGWRSEGFAASDASDACAVLSLSGAELRELVAEATAADLDAGSPSAAILFAGVPALLYRVAEAEARLHVEAALWPYVWRWLETRQSAH
jgi:sarcosine oxidase gamma subunit